MTVPQSQSVFFLLSSLGRRLCVAQDSQCWGRALLFCWGQTERSDPVKTIWTPTMLSGSHMHAISCAPLSSCLPNFHILCFLRSFSSEEQREMNGELNESTRQHGIPNHLISFP